MSEYRSGILAETGSRIILVEQDNVVVQCAKVDDDRILAGIVNFFSKNWEDLCHPPLGHKSSIRCALRRLVSPQVLTAEVRVWRRVMQKD